MKKKRFLFSLLMAIVMMAMSPQKVWADEVTIETCTCTYNDDMDYVYQTHYQSGVVSLYFSSDDGDDDGGYVLIGNNNGVSYPLTISVAEGHIITKVELEKSLYDFTNLASSPSGSISTDDNVATITGLSCRELNITADVVRIKRVKVTYDHQLTAHPAVDATCTTDGYSAYWSCSKCGKYFSDAGGKNVIEKDSWVIPAPGHTLTAHPAVDATLASDGNSAYWSCSVCGKYFNDAEGKNEIAENSWVIAKTTNISLGTRYIDGVLYYEIGSAEDLLAFRTLTTKGSSDGQWHMDLNAILTADIVYDGTTKVDPIGFIPGLYDDYNKEYTGIFDGNNHTIKNLRINTLKSNTAMYCHALFYKLNGATIKNLQFTDAYFEFSGYWASSGLLAETARNTTFANIYVEGTYKCNSYGYSGGFVSNSYETYMSLQLVKGNEKLS